MTVGEVIEELEKHDPNMPCYISDVSFPTLSEAAYNEDGVFHTSSMDYFHVAPDPHGAGGEPKRDAVFFSNTSSKPR